MSAAAVNDGVPMLIAMSDNGPQMRSHSSKQLMAASAIMQRFGRPGTPTDQAWIESRFGHANVCVPLAAPGAGIVDCAYIRAQRYRRLRIVGRDTKHLRGPNPASALVCQ